MERGNHFNLLRILLAGGVLLTHCFPLSSGHGYFTGDPWFEFTQGVRTLGTTCVLGFFIISGYLVSKSFGRSPDLLTYLRARVLRIYPAAIVCALVSALLLGPLVTSLSASEYFSSAELKRFLFYSSTFLTLKNTARSLPGIFAANPVPGNMNGSLWTISWELLCYVVLIPFGYLLYRSRGRFGRVAAWTLLALLIAVGSAINAFHFLPKTLYAGFFGFWAFFSIGIFYRAALPRLPGSPSATALGAALFLLVERYQVDVPALGLLSPFLFGYVLLTAATQLPRAWLAYNRLGDFSFGLYLYAFPLTQTMVFLFPGLTGWQLFPLALAATIGPAVLSWRWIEQPFLRLKKRAAAEAAAQVPAAA